MASTKPTEQEYTAAMERHGTDAWTPDDARTADRWLGREDVPAEVVAEVAPKADKPVRGH